MESPAQTRFKSPPSGAPDPLPEVASVQTLPLTKCDISGTTPRVIKNPILSVPLVVVSSCGTTQEFFVQIEPGFINLICSSYYISSSGFPLTTDLKFNIWRRMEVELNFPSTR